MPFKSKKQERYLQINEPEIYQDWVEKYGRFSAESLCIVCNDKPVDKSHPNAMGVTCNTPKCVHYLYSAESFGAEAIPIRHSRRLNGYYGIKGYDDASEDGFTYRIYRSPGTNDWFRAMVYDDNSLRDNFTKPTSRRLNPSGEMVISNDPASLLIGAFPKLEDAKRALVFRMIQDGNYHQMMTDGNLKWLLKDYYAESFGAEGDYEPSFDSLEERIEWMEFAVNDKFLHQYEDDYSTVVLDIEEWNENNGNNSKLSNLVKQYKNKTGWMDAESFSAEESHNAERVYDKYQVYVTYPDGTEDLYGEYESYQDAEADIEGEGELDYSIIEKKVGSSPSHRFGAESFSSKLARYGDGKRVIHKKTQNKGVMKVTERKVMWGGIDMGIKTSYEVYYDKGTHYYTDNLTTLTRNFTPLDDEKNAESFSADGYKGIPASKIEILEWYVRNGGKAWDFHDLPTDVQIRLQMGNIHELLFQDVNRWLQDNGYNPHMETPDWLAAESYDSALVHLKSLMPINRDSYLRNFRPSELTHSSTNQINFNQASVNYSAEESNFYITGYFPKAGKSKRYSVYEYWMGETGRETETKSIVSLRNEIPRIKWNLGWRDGDYSLEGTVRKVKSMYVFTPWYINGHFMYRDTDSGPIFRSKTQWDCVIEAIEYAYDYSIFKPHLKVEKQKKWWQFWKAESFAATTGKRMYCPACQTNRTWMTGYKKREMDYTKGERPQDFRFYVCNTCEYAYDPKTSLEIKNWKIKYYDAESFGAEGYDSALVHLKSLMPINRDSYLRNFRPSELTHSSTNQINFNQASVNYSAENYYGRNYQGFEIYKEGDEQIDDGSKEHSWIELPKPKGYIRPKSAWRKNKHWKCEYCHEIKHTDKVKPNRKGCDVGEIFPDDDWFAESFNSYKVAPDLSSYTKAELVSSIAGPQGTAAYDEVVYDPLAQSRLSAESIDSFSPARLIVLGASIGVALGLYNTRRD